MKYANWSRDELIDYCTLPQHSSVPSRLNKLQQLAIDEHFLASLILANCLPQLVRMWEFCFTRWSKFSVFGSYASHVNEYSEWIGQYPERLSQILSMYQQFVTGNELYIDTETVMKCGGHDERLWCKDRGYLKTHTRPFSGVSNLTGSYLDSDQNRIAVKTSESTIAILQVADRSIKQMHSISLPYAIYPKEHRQEYIQRVRFEANSLAYWVRKRDCVENCLICLNTLQQKIMDRIPTSEETNVEFFASDYLRLTNQSLRSPTSTTINSRTRECQVCSDRPNGKHIAFFTNSNGNLCEVTLMGMNSELPTRYGPEAPHVYDKNEYEDLVPFYLQCDNTRIRFVVFNHATKVGTWFNHVMSWEPDVMYIASDDAYMIVAHSHGQPYHAYCYTRNGTSLRLEASKVIPTLDYRNPMYCRAHNAILMSADRNWIECWNSDTGKNLGRIGPGNNAMTAGSFCGGRVLATLSDVGVQLWDWPFTDSEMCTPYNNIYEFVASANGDHILVSRLDSDNDWRICLIEVESWSVINHVKVRDKNQILGFCCSGEVAAFVTQSGIGFWSVASGQSFDIEDATCFCLLQSMDELTRSCCSIAENSHLITIVNYEDQRVHIFDLKVREYIGGWPAIGVLALSANGNVVVWITLREFVILNTECFTHVSIQFSSLLDDEYFSYTEDDNAMDVVVICDEQIFCELGSKCFHISLNWITREYSASSCSHLLNVVTHHNQTRYFPVPCGTTHYDIFDKILGCVVDRIAVDCEWDNPLGGYKLLRNGPFIRIQVSGGLYSEILCRRPPTFQSYSQSRLCLESSFFVHPTKPRLVFLDDGEIRVVDLISTNGALITPPPSSLRQP